MRRVGRGDRGSSLIEVLVAIAILALMMVGILQMFSVALVTNYGSAARTEMTYKAQQVVENLRLIYFFARQGNNTLATAAGVPTTIVSTGTTPVLLPATSTDSTTTLTWAYWGPGGANCVEADNPPYRLGYSVTDGGAFWIVTATATPVDNPAAPIGATPLPGGRRYLGEGSKVKRVDYVAQLPK